MTTPPIIWGYDDPRTRSNDPLQSHAAADYSQKSIHALRNNLYRLVWENPNITGTELNEMYRDTYRRRGWKRVAYDSPRKRAGEMVAGLLLIAGPVRDGGQQYTTWAFFGPAHEPLCS